uniref:Uncharacterized protein n=1 Tax=Arundo donax TaxID=35708 RepID=A0A0A8ZI86_ARUDO
MDAHQPCQACLAETRIVRPNIHLCFYFSCPGLLLENHS